MSPGAEELGGRAAAVPDESVAAGEADLAAVGVSAEHEVEAIAACLVVDFGAVREKDAAGARRDTVAGGFEIVGAVEVRVIGAGDPELLAVVFDRDIFVEEDAESGLFEMRDDFDDVVVAEDGEGAGLEGGGDAADVGEAILEVPGGMIGKVAGDDGEVVRGFVDQGDEAIGEAFDAIEVEVGKLQKAEAVDGGREIGEGLLAGDGADVEAVGAAAGGETGPAEEEGDEAVDGNNTFDGEGAFTLMDEAGAEVGLAVEALAEEAGSEAGGEGAKVDAGVRHGRTISRKLFARRRRVALRRAAFRLSCHSLGRSSFCSRCGRRRWFGGFRKGGSLCRSRHTSGPHPGYVRWIHL